MRVMITKQCHSCISCAALRHERSPCLLLQNQTRLDHFFIGDPAWFLFHLPYVSVVRYIRQIRFLHLPRSTPYDHSTGVEITYGIETVFFCTVYLVIEFQAVIVEKHTSCRLEG